MRFSVVVAAGPDTHEPERIAALAEQLRHFEAKHLQTLLVMDDGGGRHDWSCCSRLPFIRIRSSARDGRGDPWRGGLTSIMLRGYRELFAEPEPPGFVLKLDTDSFIIGEFAERIGRRYREDPRLGLVGSCFEYDLSGSRVPPSTWKINLDKLRRPLRLRRKPVPHPQQAWVGWHAKVRHLINQALSHGWDLGSCAQGGGYALAGHTYRAWMQAGIPLDPEQWLHNELTEDVVFSMMSYAVGHPIQDFNRPGEPFGVQHKGLGFPPHELVSRGYAILHSMKASSWDAEQAVREELVRLSRAAAEQRHP